MRPNRAHCLLALAALAAAASPLAAQAGVEWVEFSKQPGLLGPGVATLSNATTEMDFAVADLDLDGDLDVVAARRRAGGLVGFRTDVLLMNESGVLVPNPIGVVFEFSNALDILIGT